MSPTDSDARWSGCHGVRVDGEPVDVGTASGKPLATATVQFGAVEATGGEVLWVQRGEAGTGESRRVVDRTLTRRPDGRLLLSGSHGPVVDVDQRTATITIDSHDEVTHRQLVASFALPLILHEADVLMMHGAACALHNETILVCGESGSGKSSTLVRLVDAGWLAVSEDVCAIDLAASGGPVVWPGPPWVRVARAERGPRSSEQLFEQVDKAAWGLHGRQTTSATPLTRLLLLEAPGGKSPLVEPVSTADAIAVLARHAVWLQEQGDRARRLFAPLAALASRVPAFRVRLPRDDRWSENLPDLLASAVLIS